MRWTTLAAVLVLTACAQEPVWNKAGGSPAVFEQVSSTCFRGASIEARVEIEKRGVGAAPQIELRSSAGRVRDSAGAARQAISLQEKAIRGKLYSQCMHRLGYRLKKPE